MTEKGEKSCKEDEKINEGLGKGNCENREVDSKWWKKTETKTISHIGKITRLGALLRLQQTH